MVSISVRLSTDTFPFYEYFPKLSGIRRADERTRTAYPCSITSDAVGRCRALHGLANAAYLEGFLFSGLLSVAPYCVPCRLRVVSI